MLYPPPMKMPRTTFPLFLFLLLTLTLTPSSHARTHESLPLNLRDLPPLEDLEPYALKAAGLDPSRIQKWHRGVRWSAALPRIQVGWENKFINQNTNIIQDTISVTSSGVTVGPESSRLDADIENNRDFEIRAIWAFDELLFNRDQIAVSREARDLFFVRSKLLEELRETYYELKALLLEAQLSPDSKGPYQRLKIENLSDKLNSLCGGQFKKLLQLQNQEVSI